MLTKLLFYPPIKSIVKEPLNDIVNACPNVKVDSHCIFFKVKVNINGFLCTYIDTVNSAKSDAKKINANTNELINENINESITEQVQSITGDADETIMEDKKFSTK